MSRESHDGGRESSQSSYPIVLPRAPISLQGSARSKAMIGQEIRTEAAKFGRYLTGEVSIEIEWRLAERLRWESGAALGSPDIDNIMKPLIDGLCGTGNLLFDDCQVQSVACSWIDWTLEDQQQITITVTPLMIDDWFGHDPIIWLDMGDSLCWPIHPRLEREIQAAFVERFESALRLRSELVASGLSLYDASFHMPIQRRFHRAHLQRHGFDVVNVETYKRERALPPPPRLDGI